MNWCKPRSFSNYICERAITKFVWINETFTMRLFGLMMDIMSFSSCLSVSPMLYLLSKQPWTRFLSLICGDLLLFFSMTFWFIAIQWKNTFDIYNVFLSVFLSVFRKGILSKDVDAQRIPWIPHGGHAGVQRTYLRLASNIFWEGMCKDV